MSREYDWSINRDPRAAEREIVERFKKSGFWYPHLDAPYKPVAKFKGSKKPIHLSCPEEIFSILYRGNIKRLMWPGAVATPVELHSAIANIDKSDSMRHMLDNLTFMHVHTNGHPYHLQNPASSFVDMSFFVGENYRKPIYEQQTGITKTNAYFKPIHLSQIAPYINSYNEAHATALLVTPPDNTGYCSIINPDVIQPSLEKSISSGGPIFAFMNYRMPNEDPKLSGPPRTFGATGLHMSQIDYVINIDRSLPIHQAPVPDPLSMEIGENVASILRGDENIQLGIGAVIDAAAASLIRKSKSNEGGNYDFKIWTEVAYNNVYELMKEGLVTNDRYPFRGKTVTSFINGDKIVPYVNQNENFVFLPAWITNRTDFLMMLDNMTCIVGALKADTTGQIASDTDDRGRIISGSGGQLDFMYGSYPSRGGGKAIVVLKSVFEDKEGLRHSNVVSHLENPVTTVRSCQLWIASENGVAENVYSRSLQETQNMMIENVAHPDFRPRLRDETGIYSLPY